MALPTKRHLLEPVADEISISAPQASRRAYFLVQLLVWGGYFFTNLLIAQAAGKQPINLSSLLAIFLALSLLMAVATHLIRALHQRFAQGWSVTRLALNLLWGLPVMAALVQLSLFAFLFVARPLLRMSAEASAPEPGLLLIYWFNTLIMLSLWSLGYLLVHQFRRARHAQIAHWQIQAQLHHAELQFLRSQINAHFLFNALNNLRALIRVDPELARSRLTQLGTLLRAILQGEHRESLPLRDELEIVQAYLDMEALQYDQRLTVQWQIDPETLPLLVPALALQTLAENAIKHGISCRTHGGTICIQSTLRGQQLELKVLKPMAEHLSAHTGAGIGLRNVRARIRHTAGPHASLVLNQVEQQMCATLSLPKRLGELAAA